jgi:hypothetical protein
VGTEFVSQGYIEVWFGGELVSRHRVEREAVESVLRDDRDGEYELRFPTVRVIHKKPIIEPSAPEIGTPTASVSALSIPLVRASTGPTNVTEYVLQRSATSPPTIGDDGWAEIARGALFASGPYVDSGLPNSTQFWYRALAVDTTGRQSRWAATVTGTTPAGGDTTAPTVPTGLLVSQGGSGVLLVSWTASTDASGIASYDVLRGTGDGSGGVVGSGAVVATVTGTSYSDSGLTLGQEYYYRVLARDNAGNTSAYTARVFATPSAPQGGGVALDYNATFETSISPFFESKVGSAIVAVDATHAREGTKSLLTHCQDTTQWRAEVSLGYGGCVPMQAASWYGWSVYADDNWTGDFPTWEAFGQWHTRDDTMSPPVAFETGFRSGYGTGNLLFRVSWSTAAPPTTFTGNQIWNLGRMDTLKGQWLDFVMYFVPSSTATGQLRLWMNGTEVATRLNAPNYVADSIGPYWKMGIYNGWRYGDATPGITERKAWWDCYRQVTDPAAVYADVAPQGNRLTAP